MKTTFILGIAFFIGGAFDSVIRGAKDFSELSTLGQTCVIGFCSCLGYLTVLGIIGLVKKRK